MIDRLMTSVSAFIVATISALGYGGVVLMMAIESACIPLPSEVIMPFSGYLVSTGRFDLQPGRDRRARSDACSARTSRTSSARAADAACCCNTGATF